MAKHLILVCDDAKKTESQWCERLTAVSSIAALVQKGWSVQSIDGRTLEEEVERLESRRVRANSKATDQDEGPSLFDEAAVVLVDYELTDLEKVIYLTGESVSYLARCYSDCGVIVGMNNYGSSARFDLTLRGHPNSYADVHISDHEATHDGLWSGNWTGYRPWYWPVLPEAAIALEANAQEVRDNLDQRVLEYFGFTGDLRYLLTRDAEGFLSGKTNSEETTFEQLADTSHNVMRGRDVADRRWLARVLAARLMHWLQWLVLPGQDVLVDAPHLVERFPSLLAGDISKQDCWNAVARYLPAGKLPLAHSKLEGSAFTRSGWLAQPTWFWSSVQQNREISEIRDPFGAKRPAYRFCEDISAFLPEEQTRPFVSSVESTFAERRVADPATVPAGLRDALITVEYEPALRFSL